MLTIHWHSQFSTVNVQTIIGDGVLVRITRLKITKSWTISDHILV